MQIQWWEGAASSCAEAVLQSATRDSMSREAGCLRKRIVKSVVEELEKELRSAARHSVRRASGYVQTRISSVLDFLTRCRLSRGLIPPWKPDSFRFADDPGPRHRRRPDTW